MVRKGGGKEERGNCLFCGLFAMQRGVPALRTSYIRCMLYRTIFLFKIPQNQKLLKLK